MIARIVLACALPSFAFTQSPAGAARKPMSDEMLRRVRPIMDALYRLDYPPAEALCLKTRDGSLHLISPDHIILHLAQPARRGRRVRRAATEEMAALAPT